MALINKNYPAFISKEDVITLIEEQAKPGHYIEGLSYELVNLDNDVDSRLLPKLTECSSVIFYLQTRFAWEI